MSVKRFSPGTVSLLTPHGKHQDSEAVSPPQCDFSLGKWATETKPSTLVTKPPVRTSIFDSMLMPPIPPKRGCSSFEQSSSSHRVLFQEMLSSQIDIGNAPEEEFFLIGPSQVLGHVDDQVAPLLVRPRALRIGEIINEPMSAVATACSSLFRSIGEDVDDDESPPLPVAQQVRLKPRPASLHDGQRAWESMSTFTCFHNDYGAEILE